MLTAERNELLTRVGRGTPIGELFRRYWLPVLLGEELPDAVAMAQKEPAKTVSTA